MSNYYYATPSAPWPWLDINDEVDPQQLFSDPPPASPLCDKYGGHEECWKKYPESRFPVWTERQIKKSKILEVIRDRGRTCKLYYIDVDDHGKLTSPAETVVGEDCLEQSWKFFLDDYKHPPNFRVRFMFMENLSGPVLQMLGTKFNVEPFFWSSSLNWIPSHYQEDLHPGYGDHITICLTFPRSIPHNTNMSRRHSSDTIVSRGASTLDLYATDSQAPLPLRSNDQLLILDLLSVHLIRNAEGNIIISYTPSPQLQKTTSKHLHQRIQLAGRSMYWKTIFQKSPDPTFMLLIFLWHVMYAWGEALAHLYVHVCYLESCFVQTCDMHLTMELHIIRAQFKHYSSLLDDFRETVKFILETPNPALEKLEEHEREFSENALRRECQILLKGIRKLELGRGIQDKRLENVMNLVFTNISIGDSKRMQMMAEAAVRSGGGIAQVLAYVSMLFLPASFVAALFGMNIKEFAPETYKSLADYVYIAVGLTVITLWFGIAAMYRGSPFLRRLGWPALLLLRKLRIGGAGGPVLSTQM